MRIFVRDESENPARGTWRRTKTSAGPSANIVCPQCGTEGALDHEIAADGAVSPSLVCPGKGCTFHEYGKLEGWEP